MALYWPDARMAVECTEAEGSQTGGERREDGVLVISMRPEQADDPAFVEAMQQLVMARTVRHEREIYGRLMEGWERGKAPAPVCDAPGEEGPSEAERAFERSFVESAGNVNGMGGAPDKPSAASGNSDQEPRLDELLESYLGQETYREGCGPLVQVVVQHCDELAVGA